MTTPTATPKTPSATWTSPTCQHSGRPPRRPPPTPTSPRCVPDATTAHRRAQHLARAILRDRAGPAEAAAAAELAELHTRHQQQRRHQHNLAHAHADWVTAEHTAEAHRALLDQLTTQITDAHTRGDDDLATTYRRYRDELAQHTSDIDAAVQQTRRHLDDARNALLDAPAAPRASSPNATSKPAEPPPNEPTSTPSPRPALTPATSTTSSPARKPRPHARSPPVRPAAPATTPRSRWRGCALRCRCWRPPARAAPPPCIGCPTRPWRRWTSRSRRAVIAIANSAHTVHPLQLHDGADKPAALAALAATAHHHQPRILALAATQRRRLPTPNTATPTPPASPTTARDHLQAGRWHYRSAAWSSSTTPTS